MFDILKLEYGRKVNIKFCIYEMNIKFYDNCGFISVQFLLSVLGILR